MKIHESPTVHNAQRISPVSKCAAARGMSASWRWAIPLMAAIVWLATSGHVSASTTWMLGPDLNPAPGLSISGYANTGSGSTIDTQKIEAQSNMTFWSGGWGINNADRCTTWICFGRDANEGSSPEHALDNDQRYEMALLNFTNPVKLTEMKIGWYDTDSDMTVLAYTGHSANGAFDLNTKLIGKTFGELLGAGWAAIGHYGNVTSHAGYTAPIDTHVFSSYWLIGAYNPLANTNPAPLLGAGNDHVKLLSVSTVSPNVVPEPGSLALLGLAFAAMVGLRKRAQD